MEEEQVIIEPKIEVQEKKTKKVEEVKEAEKAIEIPKHSFYRG